jgi:hypothetical protein
MEGKERKAMSLLGKEGNDEMPGNAICNHKIKEGTRRECVIPSHL